MTDDHDPTSARGADTPSTLRQDAPTNSPSTLNPSAAPDAPTGRVLAVEAAIRIESPNRLHAEHHLGRARRVRKERAAVLEALAPFAVPPGPWLITLVRVAPRRLDDDNAVAAMKAPRDAVAEWLGVDDRDPRVLFVVEQGRGSYSLRVEVRSRQSERCP